MRAYAKKITIFFAMAMLVTLFAGCNNHKFEKTENSLIISAEELKDYIRCMTISQNVDPDVYNYLTEENVKEINEYIDDPMTATWFNDGKHGGRKEVITSEIVYYWMIAQQIPPEYDKWHFNRLMTLIRVCSEKNAPKKKMSNRDILSRNKALNEARKKAHHTRG